MGHLLVYGETYKHRERLKEIGAKWKPKMLDEKGCCWAFSSDVDVDLIRHAIKTKADKTKHDSDHDIVVRLSRLGEEALRLVLDLSKKADKRRESLIREIRDEIMSLDAVREPTHRKMLVEQALNLALEEIDI